MRSLHILKVEYFFTAIRPSSLPLPLLPHPIFTQCLFYPLMATLDAFVLQFFFQNKSAISRISTNLQVCPLNRVKRVSHDYLKLYPARFSIIVFSFVCFLSRMFVAFSSLTI